MALASFLFPSAHLISIRKLVWSPSNFGHIGVRRREHIKKVRQGAWLHT